MLDTWSRAETEPCFPSMHSQHNVTMGTTTTAKAALSKKKKASTKDSPLADVKDALASTEMGSPVKRNFPLIFCGAHPQKSAAAAAKAALIFPPKVVPLPTRTVTHVAENTCHQCCAFAVAHHFVQWQCDISKWCYFWHSRLKTHQVLCAWAVLSCQQV